MTTPSPGQQTVASEPIPDTAPAQQGTPGLPLSRLTVLSGPSGVGKGTITADIRARYPQVWLSVSVTTRPARPGEIDGVHYHFVDDATFDSLVADGELLEWALIHGQQRSGTPRGPVRRALAEGRPALLEIDIQGAEQVRASMPEALFVFVAPPSLAELERRLAGRGTEDQREQDRRLHTARTELAAADRFDTVIVNTEVRQASDDLVHCMGLREDAT